MKNLILVFAVALLISITACAQTPQDLPVKIKTAFDQKFPGAQKVKWSKENTTEWEAEFKMAGKEYSANYTADGTWMETEYEIAASEIPAAVIQTLSKEFPGYKLVESEVSETTKGKVYEFEIKTGMKKTEVALDENGVIQK
jgi:hypothetical protein